MRQTALPYEFTKLRFVLRLNQNFAASGYSVFVPAAQPVPVSGKCRFPLPLYQISQSCSSWKDARSAAYSPVQRLSELRLAEVESSAHWLILDVLNTLPAFVVCLQLIMVEKSYTNFFLKLRFKSIYTFVSYTIPPGREELCCWEVEILPSLVNHLEGHVVFRELPGSFCLLDSSHSSSILCGVRVAMNPH